MTRIKPYRIGLFIDMVSLSDILNQMVVEVIIPARYASTRLPGKPLADIGGRPMIEWVYKRALRAKLVERVTVATDDERIFNAVRAFGGSVVMTGGSHGSGTERIAEAATLGSGVLSEDDIIVNLQGDEPMIEPSVIDAAIMPMLDDPSLMVSTLKTRMKDAQGREDPNVVKVVTDINGYALYFSRSCIPYQNLEGGGVYKHIGLYVYRRAFLKEFSTLSPTPLERAETLEQLRILENGVKIKVVETDVDPVSVDTEQDLIKVNKLTAAQSGLD